MRPAVIFQHVYGYLDVFLLGVFFPNEAYVHISHDDDDDDDIFINTLRTGGGSFKLFKRPFPGFLTILNL